MNIFRILRTAEVHTFSVQWPITVDNFFDFNAVKKDEIDSSDNNLHIF
jgi:hypothetical protein